MGDKVGRIHLGRQDLGQLQTRKMKGLKRARGLEDEIGNELTLADDGEPEAGTKPKRIR